MAREKGSEEILKMEKRFSDFHRWSESKTEAFCHFHLAPFPRVGWWFCFAPLLPLTLFFIKSLPVNNDFCAREFLELVIFPKARVGKKTQHNRDVNKRSKYRILVQEFLQSLQHWKIKLGVLPKINFLLPSRFALRYCKWGEIWHKLCSRMSFQT